MNPSTARPLGLDRRSFCQRLGGGVAVLVSLGPTSLWAQGAKHLYPEDFNAYLLVGANGRVTVCSGKIEMGQGVMTAQAQMVAEELGVELAAIDMVLGDTDRCPWDMGTFGSLTTRMFGPALRAAGAQARLVLMTMAGERLKVPVDGLVVSRGVVSVAADPSRSVSYAALAQGARITRIVDHKAVLRAAADFKLVGTSPQRLDARAKVTGTAQYAADIRLPGMLYARVLRPPMHGATMGALDTSAAEKLAGVTVVRRGDFVAVLHAEPEVATQALAAIQAGWQLPQAPPQTQTQTQTQTQAQMQMQTQTPTDPDSIFEHILSASPAPTPVSSHGDVSAARARATQVFEATYQKGYVAHAALETHAALAEFKGGRMTVWASTQTPFPARDAIAKALGLDGPAVRVITPLLGGGFGGKSAFGQAIEAARLAQITGKPVQVAWTRAETFFNDTFDPAAVVKLASAVDPTGRIALWDYTVLAAGVRATTLPYALSDARVRSAGKNGEGPADAGHSVHPFAVGAWRGPGANMNVFAAESQIDTMASALGIDPLEFRLRNLTDARMVRVLQAAAAAFGWQAAPAPSGRGHGLACAIDAGTYVATMAEVKVDAATGQVRVLRIVCAQDMGIVVNPEGAKMQIEGGLTMGLGYTLSEELRFRGGEILDRNFDSYAIPRFSTAARVQAVLVKNDALAPQGGGEPAITTTGAVIANAVFDAAGVRMLRLPMRPERVRQAIAARRVGARSLYPGRSLATLALAIAVTLGMSAASPLMAQPAAMSPQLTPLVTPGSNEHHVGKVVLMQLVTPDLAVAKRFYGGLFGWRFRDLKLGGEDYAEATLDQQVVAGLLHKAMPAGERRQSSWLTFLAVRDVDATKQLALANGAKVLLEPRTIPNRGRVAVFSDPQGAVFAVLASSSGDPPDEWADPGEWIWASLSTSDPDANAGFYQTLFDYEVFDLPADAGARHLVLASDSYARASANTLPASRPGARPHWMNYVHVEDVAAATARVQALGGRVLVLPRPDRHGGRVAIVADPLGAAFGLLEWPDGQVQALTK